MDPSHSDSDEESVCGSSRWEVVASDPDTVFSDSNGDGQMHEHGVEVLPQHFDLIAPPQGGVRESKQEADISRGRESSSSATVTDWIEPARIMDEQQDSGQHRQQDLDLLSTLVSSVLESEKREAGAEAGIEAERFDNLDREILGEAGFSSLVPSDFHGNVLRAEEQEEGEAIGEDDDEIGFGRSWKRALVTYIKRASTLWSLTIAAALMGLVIIGQRWHHERWQNHQLRLRLCYKDEKISQLLFQIARLKETVSGRRRVPVIKASSV